MPFTLTVTEIQEIHDRLKRRHKDLVWSEASLLRLIRAQKSKMDVYWSVIGLRDCGTSQSVPALKKLAGHPMQDIKATSIITIAQIAGAAETAYYAERLLDPSYRAKGFALWAIGAVGNSEALPAVESYIARNKKKLSDGCSPMPQLQQQIAAYFYRIFDQEYATNLLSTKYRFLAAAIADGLSKLPARATESFYEQVPAYDRALMSLHA